ncbi:unnamed protein product, partial [Ectocarpus sp. 6 AP-2014]
MIDHVIVDAPSHSVLTVLYIEVVTVIKHPVCLLSLSRLSCGHSSPGTEGGPARYPIYAKQSQGPSPDHLRTQQLDHNRILPCSVRPLQLPAGVLFPSIRVRGRQTAYSSPNTNHALLGVRTRPGPQSMRVYVVYNFDDETKVHHMPSDQQSAR